MNKMIVMKLLLSEKNKRLLKVSLSLSLYKIYSSTRSLTMSYVRIGVNHVTLAVYHGVDLGASAVGREVSTSMFNIVGAILQHYLSFEHPIRHRTEHSRLWFIC